MFYKNKKKEYSEVSESKLNINSDYFNIFQNEFKKYFPNNNINDDTINKHDHLNKNYNSADNNNIINVNNDINTNTNTNTKTKTNTNINTIKEINNKFLNKNTMVNDTFKNVELDNNDIFFINLFVQHINKNK